MNNGTVSLSFNHTLSSDIKDTKDGTEIFVIGKVEDLQIKSAMIKGVFIEEHFGVVNLVDSSGSTEIMLFSDKLKELQKMNLDESIVFNVKIIDKTFDDEIFKSIDVIGIMSLDEAKNKMDI